MPRWSIDAVEKAAPDTGSLNAARKLATPGPWSETGATDVLVWGKCQGSGKNPYQVSVDLTGPAYKCSCPSRKFPCKHAIALLLLWAGAQVGEVDEPEAYASEWASQRAARAAGAAERAAAPAKPVDKAAQARRAAERRALMDGGVEDLVLWLEDLVRGGLATAKAQPWTWWDAAASRLVDAQLPGLGERVREMAAALNRREDWAEHLLIEVGRWWTAAQAWRSWDSMDTDTQGDLRAVIGWATPTAQVLEAGVHADVWTVLGAHRDERGNLIEQRTWLRSESGETVLLLDFAAGGNPLPIARLAGARLEASVGFYPGHAPRRVVLAAEPVALPATSDLGIATDLAGARAALAALRAGNPWADRAPVVVRVAASAPEADEPPVVVDDAGHQVPLLGDPGTWWRLLALTGGHPVTVFAEIQDDGLRVLTVLVVDEAEVDGELVAL